MEENKKIRLLVVPSDASGCFLHRCRVPHIYIQEHYGDEFDVDIVYLKDFPKDNLVNFLQQYDILFFHKEMDKGGKVIDLARFLNLIIICDVDDSYKLTQDHPLFITSVKQKWSETITNHVRKSDCVITTTELYAKDLKRFNPNVVVLPNALSADDPQFTTDKIESDRIRFGVVCGSTHQKDIELMSGIASLSKDVMDKMTLEALGFDTKGSVTVYDKKTGTATKRPTTNEESVWNVYERHLTDNYKTISPEHKAFLMKYEQVEDPFGNSEPYSRFWTKDINHYGEHYKNVDVLLAPLKENDFNYRKSELKVAECAYTGTALIASNYGPYTLSLTPYLEKGMKVNPDGNALLVEPSKNHKQWAKYVQYVVEHPECIDIMVKNLRRDVLEKFSVEKVTEKRVELYRKLYKEKHS